MISALRIASAVASREMILRWQRGAWAVPLAFACIITLVFPLGITLQSHLLMHVVPSLIWIVVLFSTLLALDRSFDEDYADGTLLLDLLAPVSPSLLMIARAFAIWLVSGLPLALILPLLAVGLDLPLRVLPALTLSLFLGTPTLTLIGLFTSILTLGARTHGLLAPLLALPCTLPVLIFGSGVANAALHGESIRSNLLLEVAPLTLALFICPWATAIAARRAIYD